MITIAPSSFLCLKQLFNCELTKQGRRKSRKSSNPGTFEVECFVSIPKKIWGQEGGDHFFPGSDGPAKLKPKS